MYSENNRLRLDCAAAALVSPDEEDVGSIVRRLCLSHNEDKRNARIEALVRARRCTMSEYYSYIAVDYAVI